MYNKLMFWFISMQG